MAALASLLASAIGRIFLQILLALGIGFATYKGSDQLISYAGQQIQSYLGALPPNMIQAINLLQIPTVISIILASYVSRVGVYSAFKRFTVAK